MNLQIIKSIDGKAEYVLLPINAYNSLKPQIDKVLDHENDYETFVLDDYVSNPVALARINANLTQAELADALGVSQAYISKIESQDTVSPKTLAKINQICKL